MVSSGDLLEVLAQGTDGVAVGGDEDGAPLRGRCTQVGHDGRLPVGNGAGDDILQALGTGDVGGIEVPIAGISADVVGVVGGQRGRRGVVAAAPEHELLLTELLLDLGLVLALQVAVVPFVQPPVTADGQPTAAGGRQGELRGADGPGQDRRVQDPQVEIVGRGQQVAAGPGLDLAGGAQVDVDPPSEQVLRVPGGLAVAQQDQVEHASIVGGSTRNAAIALVGGRGVVGERPDRPATVRWQSGCQREFRP